MAVVQRDKADKVIIKVNVSEGVTPEYKNRTISKITPTITDDVAYGVATRLAGLQAYTVGGIQRSQTYTMVNET